MMCEKREVGNENHVPLFLECKQICSYSNLATNTAGKFQYRIVLGGSECDAGAVPLNIHDSAGFVYYFGPSVVNHGRLRVTMSSMAGNGSVFLQIGCLMAGVDASDLSTEKKVSDFCRDTTLEIVAEGKTKFSISAPFSGFVELWTE